MNKKYASIRRREQGSAILASLIFGSVLLILVASSTRWVTHEYKSSYRVISQEKAFHVAEFGIERALYAMQYDELDSAQWNHTNSGEWKRSETVTVDGEDVAVSVVISLVGVEQYVVTSVAETQFVGETVSRAIRIEVTMTDDPLLVNNRYKPDFIFKEKVVFGLSTGGPCGVASCDSTLYSEPDWKPRGSSGASGNTGYDVTVATLLNDPDAIVLTSIEVHGSIGVPGEIPSAWLEAGKNSKKGGSNIKLFGPDTHSGDLFDVDQIITNFEFPLEAPTYPEPPDVHTKVTYDEGFWDGKNQVIIGQLNHATYATAEGQFDPPAGNLEIIIQGEVVLHVNGPIDADANITFKMNGPDSSLILVSEEGMVFSGEVNVDSSYPNQMLILQPKDNGAIVLSTDNFKGFINAPESDVTLIATADPKGTKKNLFWGGIIGKSFAHTNSFWLLSDPSVRNKKDPNAPTAEKVAVLDAWYEIPPSSI
jgi:hypothetical protein